MRSIRIALASGAVVVSVVAGAYAAQACVGGPGSDVSHAPHGQYYPAAHSSVDPSAVPAFAHHYRGTHHHYVRHHHRHFGWWRGWHLGWFWHHGKPVRQHPTPTPTPTPTDTATPTPAPAPVS